MSANGFVIGWEIANLGNALSSLANTFVLGRRLGVVGAYPFINTYADLFRKGREIAVFGRDRSTHLPSMHELLATLEPILSTHPAHYPPENGSSFADLGQAHVSNVVWLARYEGVVLRDWSADASELCVKRFCRGNRFRRGNGLVIAGSYWRQYTDMRLLKSHGLALRQHLGDLKADGLSGRAVHMRAMSDALKIGLHVRQGDYSL